MLTCQKTFKDIPWAHRLHKHDGPCAFIHGHNWDITLTFGCNAPEANGFVVDFGKLDFIERWIAQYLDHACVFNADDPLREKLIAAAPQAWKPYIVDSCSSEGMAKHLYDTLAPLVRQNTQGRVFIVRVEIAEDKLAKAAYEA